MKRTLACSMRADPGRQRERPHAVFAKKVCVQIFFATWCMSLNGHPREF